MIVGERDEAEPSCPSDRGADAINRLTRTGPRVGFSRSHKSAGFTPRSRLTLAGVRAFFLSRASLTGDASAAENHPRDATLGPFRVVESSSRANPSISPVPTFRFH